MNNDDKRLHVVIPGAMALLTIGGIIALDLAGKPIPDVLLILASTFGIWATGGVIGTKGGTDGGEK